MKWGILFILASLSAAGVWRIAHKWESAPKPPQMHMITRLASQYWESRRVALPPSVARYHQIGGVFEFHVFRDVAGDEASLLAAITHVLPGTDVPRLRALGWRVIDDAAFFGSWADPLTRRLTPQRTIITTPEQGGRITAIGWGSSEAGTGGDFALAFQEPPMGLMARQYEVQRLFSDVTQFVLPIGSTSEIGDWASPQLPEVHPYFIAGMEWWGVYLFTIYLPETRQLTVILASTTD